MRDVTFIVHTRIDSKERLTNFTFCMNFLQKNFDSPVIVVEQDRSSKVSGWGRHAKHIFIKSYDTLFNRTRPTNVGAKYATTEYLCLLDMDVFTSPSVYETCRNLLYDFDLVYPFNGRFYDISGSYTQNPNLSVANIDLKGSKLLNTDSVGGMQFVRTDSFMMAGMTNELILGWGYEDNEFYSRFKNMNYSITRLDIPIYHFNHPRNFNSDGRSPLIAENKAIYEKVKKMNRQEILDYINNEFYWCR